MSGWDLAIVAGYGLVLVGVGLYFLRRQTDTDAYFVGNRRMGAGHLGLSIVATDVGGGFSIGLGGLGFTMGLSGSWLLFTGLVGAWIAAVLIIPRVKPLGEELGWTTFPDYLEHRFDGRTRTLAAVVSAVGYAAFVGAQILAGAKLSSVAFQIDLTTAVLVMAAIVILYTTLGGLEAVVYTDTLQWAVLFGGLLFFGLPFGFEAVGGLEGLRAGLPEGHLSLSNVDGQTLLVWAVTIIPIWFVGNTLYQRIYASRDVKTARRAFYLAGLFEWPLIAFLGVTLGVFARILFPEVEPELGLPMLIREVLPVGVVGILMAAYFSAIMSTADSCLLASVGNLVGDLIEPHLGERASEARLLKLSRALTLLVGALSVGVALALPGVLDAVLLAYAFMVSGLFVPTLAGLLWPRTGARAAFWSMLVGGGVAVTLNLVPAWAPGPDPVIPAILASAAVLIVLTLLSPREARA
ncbi:MAG: sodium:solute symporter family protein [Deltaproteobacteria bacterium]|nr:sodium:solute symporter family protein [Deltaproteobacteria bacterium]